LRNEESHRKYHHGPVLQFTCFTEDYRGREESKEGSCEEVSEEVSEEVFQEGDEEEVGKVE
jgi:hypothetical protein